LGGPAEYLIEVSDLAGLERVAEARHSLRLPVLVLGRGSNLVVSDRGFPGVVLHLGGSFNQIAIDGEVVAGAAVSLPQLGRSAVRSGRLGLEFMVGIPGSVGGGIRQNAGCFGCEMIDVLESVELFDLETGKIANRRPDSLELGYRCSNVRPTDVVVSASFRTQAGSPAVGERRMREITNWRRLHQPGGSLNAGSVFKNPPNDAAGRIIDSLGLKGLRSGGASVSQRHANFFVADPAATAGDVYQLVRMVQQRVEESVGLRLEPEIQFVGPFDEEEADGRG
jgi:UDP-N-acetylmuramate dehydrogenase